jgi:hypothetical protein
MAKKSTKYKLLKDDFDLALRDIKLRDEVIFDLKKELEREKTLRKIFEDQASRYKQLSLEFALRKV